MRILIIIFLLTTTNIFSQKKIILSEDSKNIIPYVNIYLKNSIKGIYSNELGEFEFPIYLKKHDTLIFSALGYKTKEIIFIDEIKKKDTIFLHPDIQLLNEIVIKTKVSKKSSSHIIGVTKSKSNYQQCVLSTGSKLAVYIPNEFNNNNVLIKELIYKKLVVNYKTHIGTKIKNEVAVRLQVYKINPFTKKPDDTPLIPDNIIIYINKNGTLKYDVSKYEISLPNSGIFIALEVLGTLNKGGKIENNFGNVLCYIGTNFGDGKNTWRKWNGTDWQNEYQYSLPHRNNKANYLSFDAMFSVKVQSFE
jgi:hypothetical protein